MYATILYILLRNFHWKVVVCYVAAIALTITFADQMCSSIIRPVVARLRPANPDNPIVDMVYIVNGYRGGSYGFPSCHAANSLGLAMFVVFLFRRRYYRRIRRLAILYYRSQNSHLFGTFHPYEEKRYKTMASHYLCRIADNARYHYIFHN